MPRKRFTAEQIIPKLREAEGDQAKGRTVAQACQPAKITTNHLRIGPAPQNGLNHDQIGQ